MRILMIAPEPFFEPRGTPISVYHRARVLGQLGHEVHLATYPIGERVTLPHVRVYRSGRLPFLHHVKIGPSVSKLFLDVSLFLTATAMLLRHRYDCIHTHQEAGVFGAILGRLFGIPHLFDMHSDLVEELVNFKFTCSGMLIKLMQRIQRFMVQSAKVVIAVYPELVDTVAAIAPDKPVVLIYNTAVAAEEAERSADAVDLAEQVNRLRSELALPREADYPILVYMGTFEPYQGLDLLIESMPAVLASFPQAIYVLVGGRPEQVEHVATLARRLGVSHALRLTGQRPPEEMPAFMQLADVLLSPRSKGTNTPLKIYSYLHAGKPILATNIRSHTQVLIEPEVALLVDPTSQALAQGTLTLLADRALRDKLAHNARALAARHYSYNAFRAQTAKAYQLLTAQGSAD